MREEVWQGDCLEELKKLEDNSIDAIVTDPPYELGFMGKGWDKTGIANNVEMWSECLRVLKPGGHLLAFGGTRTYHRMASAIEDAGFEVRDMIEWVYGSGFPKSLNIGKAVDKLQGNNRETVREYETHDIRNNALLGKKGAMTVSETKGTSEWEGWGTALKPAHEPICLARKPLAEKTVAENCLKYGTGGINIDESRVDVADNEKEHFEKEWDREQSMSAELGGVAMNKGLKAVSLRDNVPTGRFPANLIHDGSDEVVGLFPNSKGASSQKFNKHQIYGGNSLLSSKTILERDHYEGFNDSGSASRFFKSIIYTAKASKSERKLSDGTYSTHPTVKPIALMEYLIKMVTPKGGIVLDPFAGSGTTLVAAKQNGFDYIGIEITEEYIPIIEARLNAVKEK